MKGTFSILTSQGQNGDGGSMTYIRLGRMMELAFVPGLRSTGRAG